MDNSNPEWEPKYEDWEEDKVEMSDSCASTNSSSHGEYGVMLQQPEYPYRGNGAIFWIDTQHIYFRYDWGLWFPVSNDDAENCSIICKRRTGTLYLCSMTNLKHIPVKIYHIDRLPEELFGKPEEKKTEESQNTRPLDNFIPVDIEEADVKSDDEDFVKNAVRSHGGGLIAESEGHQYPCAFYELNGHFLFFSFFEHVGDWLADEELSGDDKWPSWFGEESMAVSPLAAAIALREKIKPLVPNGIPFHAIVVLDTDCTVINESEFALSWDNNQVSFVRQEIIEGSGLTSIGKLLDNFKYKGNNRKALVKRAPAICDILENFPLTSTNPSNS